MDTNVILKFQRTCDCWICPDCACENLMADEFCSVCGTQRTAAAPILRAGYEEAAPMPPRPVYSGGYTPPTPYGGGTPPVGGYTPPPESDSNGSTVAIVLIIIVVIAIILGIAMS